jgi:hypothetical protein
VEILVNAGADKDVTNYHGQTSICLADELNFYEIMWLLA